MSEIETFLHDTANEHVGSTWLKQGRLHICIRRGAHLISEPYPSIVPRLVVTLDIVNVVQKGVTGKGAFRSLLGILLEYMSDPDMRGETEALYIENVHNPRLQQSLVAWHYVPCDPSVPPREYVPSYYYILPKLPT